MAFSINSFQENGFDIIALTGPDNTRVEIIPSRGALLHAFKVPRGNETLNLIDSYKNVDDLNAAFFSSFKNVKLSPFACRVRNGQYTFEDREYTIQKGALHGLLYDAPFTVQSQLADEQQAAITLTCAYKGEDSGYPFAYDCEATYRLLPGHRLEISTTLTNRSNGPIPVVDGWHPYFTTGSPVDQLELRFASTHMMEFDAGLFPTGKLLPCTDYINGKLLAGIELDNSFLLDFTQPLPLCSLRDPQKNIRIDLYPSQQYPVLQVYIPPHRNSIAIENLSGASDAFNNGIGLIRLEAGASHTLATAVVISL